MRLGERQRRPSHVPPPCRSCPKRTGGFQEITPDNFAVYLHHKRRKATGGYPREEADDDFIAECAATIEDVIDEERAHFQARLAAASMGMRF